MKKFTKGSLVTYVEDNDNRIADYIKAGWKEADYEARMPQTDADKRKAKVLDDTKGVDLVGDTTGDGLIKTKGKLKKPLPSKAINEAIQAEQTAEKDGETVDDGLIKTEGK